MLISTYAMLIGEEQISVYFILPETKGISLERMDTIFGEVDAVEAGKQKSDTGKAGAMELSIVERHELTGGDEAMGANQGPEKIA